MECSAYLKMGHYSIQLENHREVIIKYSFIDAISKSLILFIHSKVFDINFHSYFHNQAMHLIMSQTASPFMPLNS